MRITKQDLVKIAAALTTYPLVPSEWALFYLVMVDLGVSSEKLKEIKECSVQLNDSEQLSTLMQNWVDATGDGTVWLDDLISAVVSNMERFPGLTRQDIVKNLNQIRKEMGLENDSVLSPMEIVFSSVDLIRVEIYKYLSTYDKGCLRLTSKSIWNNTLSNWRKTARLRISDDDGKKAIGMKHFHEIFSKEERGEGSYALGKIIEYPFTNFEIFGKTVSPFPETWTKSEAHFWTKCAQYITSLSVNHCLFFKNSLVPTYIWIVTKACSKIEKLNIADTCDIDENYDDYSKVFATRDDKADLKENDNDNPFCYRQIKKCLKRRPKSHFSEPPKGIATNLKVLHFPTLGGELIIDANLILNVAPNLKSFSSKNPSLLEGLKICSEKEMCKLNDISFYYENEMDVTATLETYAKTYFNGIKRVNLTSDLEEWVINMRPSAIYKIISYCSTPLVTLELTFENFSNVMYDTVRSKSWFFELNSLEFPSLKKLQLHFRKHAGIIHFDFITLLKTPNLKALLIDYESVKKSFQKSKGTKDWIMNKNLLEGNSLCLDKLEEFCFDGWMVDEEDLTLFRAWFPSLKHLQVGLDKDTAPWKVLTLFNDLKSLTLTTRSKNHQDDFIVAKILHPEVRIFTECHFGKLEVVQGDKGQLKLVFEPVEIKLQNALP